jgi:hypothetical protein
MLLPMLIVNLWWAQILNQGCSQAGKEWCRKYNPTVTIQTLILQRIRMLARQGSKVRYQK